MKGFFDGMDAQSIVRMTSEAWFAGLCLFSFVWTLFRFRSRRKGSFFLELCILDAAAYMLSDIFAVYGRGKTEPMYWQMTQAANFCYFLSGILLPVLLGEYLGRYMEVRHGREKVVGFTFFRLVNVSLAAANIAMLCLTQYHGYYYYYDATNHYVRGEYFWLHILIFYGVFLNLLCFVGFNMKLLGRAKKIEVVLYGVAPLIAFAIQEMFYGLYVLNVTIAFMIVLFDVSDLQEREQEFQMQELELKETEMRVMNSQIQPHFIFNTLNAIQAMIIEDPDKAYEAVSDFSDFLRGVMRSMGSKELISAEADLKTAMGYLKIEKLRFGDKLTVETDLQDTDFAVPPLTIQPMVENAVRHGIRKKETGGTLRLKTYRDGKEHVIEVIDNGVGFNPYLVHEEQQKTGQHIGLHNVETRLKLLCNGTVDVRSRRGVGTQVIIRVPGKK